jgi:hypothetical protein
LVAGRQVFCRCRPVRGASDLYLADIESGKLERLTDDLYADLEPAWSPSGTSLAFVTDRFSTNLATLAAGKYRLALMDLSGRRILQVAGFDEDTHLDPQFSPDGRSPYFVSSPNGVPNVYRVSLGGGRPTAVTDVATGVIGITSTSPAMSIAQECRIAGVHGLLRWRVRHLFDANTPIGIGADRSRGRRGAASGESDAESGGGARVTHAVWPAARDSRL